MFRFPFVSRAVYEDVRHELFLEQQRTAAERQRVADLTQTIVELKTAGAIHVKPATDRIAHRLAAREADPIERAVDDLAVAKHDPALRRHLMKQADRLRREGKDEDEILEAVTAWAERGVTDEDTEEPEFIG